MSAQMETMQKRCSKCGDMYGLDGFHRDRSKRDGLHPICKECHKRRHRQWRASLTAEQHEHLKRVSREWRLSNPQRAALGVRNATLKAKYGIGVEEYESMLARQNGVCAICGADGPRIAGGKNLHIDHCHKTGKLRGLLCQPCNTALGRFLEEPKLLRKAAAYLENGGVSSKS